MYDLLQRDTIYWLQDNMHMIIHHDVGKKQVTHLFKMTQYLDNLCPLIRLQYGAARI